MQPSQVQPETVRVIGPDKHETTFEVRERWFNTADVYPAHSAFDTYGKASTGKVLNINTKGAYVALVFDARDSLVSINLQTFDAYGVQWEATFGRVRVSGSHEMIWRASIFSTVDGRREVPFRSVDVAKRFLARFSHLVREYPSLLLNPDGWGTGYARNSGLVLLLRSLLAGAEPTVRVLP